MQSVTNVRKTDDKNQIFIVCPYLTTFFRADNFLQLYSCDKYFISPNSTYCYWIGYLLRINKPNVQVFVPNFNTTLIDNGKQITDTRGWKTIEVDRTGF